MKPAQRNFTLDFSGESIRVITDEHLFTDKIYYNDTEARQSSAHFHLYYEVYYIARGSLLIKTGNQLLSVKENCACILPPFLEHSPIMGENNSMCIIEIEPPPGGPGLSHYFPQTPLICAADEDIRYLEIMRRLSYKQDVFSKLRIQAYMMLLITNLVERFRSNNAYDANSEPSVDKRKQLIDQYIINSFAGNPCTQELSDILHLSTKQTDRIVRKLTGHSLKALINMQRMITAKELMLQGGYKLSDIAEIVGFQSYNGFYTAFIRHYGASPKATKGGAL